MKNPVKFLALVLTEWNWAVRQPKLCKALMLSGRTAAGDEFIGELFRALLCHSGDWRAAAAWLDFNRPQFFGRVTKFRKWAAKITAPARRGNLIEWKGGMI